MKSGLSEAGGALEVPDEAEIWLDGRRVAECGRRLVPPHECRIGFVFQDLALWPHLTVRENLAWRRRAIHVEVAIAGHGNDDAGVRVHRTPARVVRVDCEDTWGHVGHSHEYCRQVLSMRGDDPGTVGGHIALLSPAVPSASPVSDDVLISGQAVVPAVPIRPHLFEVAEAS